MEKRARAARTIYLVTFLLVAGSFLAEILRGGCPVP